MHIKRLLLITKVTHKFDKFQETSINCNLAKKLDETIITEDETIEPANETWWDLMNYGKSSDKERLFQFSNWLVTLSDRSKVFVHKIAHSSDGGINGVVWNTYTINIFLKDLGHACA